MRKEEFYVLNSLYNGSIGRAGCTYDVEETKALNDTDIYNKLVKTGYIEKESGSITKTGLEHLSHTGLIMQLFLQQVHLHVLFLYHLNSPKVFLKLRVNVLLRDR